MADPSSLLLLRTFPKDMLLLTGEANSALEIWGQMGQADGTVLLSDFNNGQVNRLDVQTGVLQIAFEESEPDWRVSNARMLDTRRSNVLVVTEEKENDTRVVIAKKNKDDVYQSDHVVLLNEATSRVEYSLSSLL